VTDTDELLSPVVELFSLEAEADSSSSLALLALVALGVLAVIGITREWVVPFLVANLGWISAALATIAILVLLVAAIAEGRIDNERGVMLFTERSPARWRSASVTGCRAPSATCQPGSWSPRTSLTHRPDATPSGRAACCQV
jgi:hypothetical protein